MGGATYGHVTMPQQLRLSLWIQYDCIRFRRWHDDATCALIAVYAHAHSPSEEIRVQRAQRSVDPVHISQFIDTDSVLIQHGETIQSFVCRFRARTLQMPSHGMGKRFETADAPCRLALFEQGISLLHGAEQCFASEHPAVETAGVFQGIRASRCKKASYSLSQ